MFVGVSLVRSLCVFGYRSFVGARPLGGREGCGLPSRWYLAASGARRSGSSHRPLQRRWPSSGSGSFLKQLRGSALKPAAEHWRQQFGALRPLEVRLAPAKALHDRLIQVDGSTVWVLGQSFNGLATRAHTSLVRMDDPESAALKIAAYAVPVVERHDVVISSR
jgi:hypothetical protein